MSTFGTAVSYIVCATPRSGSTLLCGLLRSTGLAGQPESYFRRPDEPAWGDRWGIERDDAGGFDYREYVGAAVTEGSTDNRVFGARVMWGTLEEMVATLAAAHPKLAGDDLGLLTRAFGRTRFVHLRRDDTVAQAVSWARAEQTDYWQHGDTPLRRTPSFDFAQIDRLVRIIDEHNAAWLEWFAASGVEPHRVCYEDLAADMAGVTRGILDFLGLEPPHGADIVPIHRRQSDEINRNWIARYRAMVSHSSSRARRT